MTKKTNKAPVVIDLETTSKKEKAMSPADAPAVLDISPQGEAMQVVTRVATRRSSKLLRFFVWSVLSLITFTVSIAFWDFINDLMARNIWLGRLGLGLSLVALICLFVFSVKEVNAFFRLKKMDHLQAESSRLLQSDNLVETRKHAEKLAHLLKGREELAWALSSYSEHKDEGLDVGAVLGHAEQTLMQPLDRLAIKEIEVASRQVATATALIPLALVDVLIAMSANIKMIRRIAEVYGGRAGTFGSWRLLKAVAGHLVATGAVAIGDDLLGSVAGGSVLSKVSRRFGEGLVNGALTARVGIAAMQVCRPMPFNYVKQPKVTGIVKRALTGMFGKS